MADFRTVTKGPDYEGPDDGTVIDFITAWGTRKLCSYSELVKQFGESNRDRLNRRLFQMIDDGNLITVMQGNETFYMISQ